jgi:hypothetical protein
LWIQRKVQRRREGRELFANLVFSAPLLSGNPIAKRVGQRQGIALYLFCTSYWHF